VENNCKDIEKCVNCRSHIEFVYFESNPGVGETVLLETFMYFWIAEKIYNVFIN